MENIDEQKIVVRTSLVPRTEGHGEKTLRYYTHTAELLALQEITAHLSKHNVHLDTTHFYSDDVVSEYVVLLGSTTNTSLSGVMLGKTIESTEMTIRELGDDVKWNFFKASAGKHSEITIKGNPHTCKHDDSQVKIDFGLIVRRTRPNGGVILLVAGIHAYGTYAAANVALRPDFQKFVRSQKVTSFAQLVKVEVRNGKEISNAAINWEKKDFVVIDPLKS
ncbi:hypothetical protein ACO0K9_09915 [Undibacterium sp. Ji50W]|uniref:hypothetical protein n=1 Tax=Undibacterium sp. Ji50W TaxID=3413041 RepID=UPI003BF10C56